jgi:hypothetical protein
MGVQVMRRWTAFVLILVFSPAVARGQEAPVLGGLAAQPGWAGFAVVGGRLAVLDAPPRFEKRTGCADADGQVSESICIKSAGSVAAIHYEFVSPRERLTVEAVGSERVEIHRIPQDEDSPVELHLIQSPGREIVMTIGAGASRREFSAPTFWRLMLAEPDLVRDCLTPLLESLRPDWGLRRQAAAIEHRLFELAAVAPAPDAASWRAAVEELRDPRFIRREAADRVLRAAGQPLLPFLEQLDRSRMDAEQRARIVAIRQSLMQGEEDSPPRVASRMLYDQSAWLILMAREDAGQRAAAARHLCKICPEAIAFDPQADQAVRRAQLKQLRQQLAHD